MKLYLRILGYLRPHGGVLTTSAAATLVFAALDAFSLVLIIPFLQVLLGVPGPVAVEGAGAGRLGAILEATVGRWVSLRGDPLVAVQGIILFILSVFIIKNLIQIDGQRNSESCSFTNGARHLNCAPMLCHDTITNRQPKSLF